MLLILLTIVAFTIISSVIVSFTERSLEKTKCFEFRDYFLFDESFGYNCYDDDANRYILSIKARSDNSNAELVKGFSLRLLSETSSVSVTVKDEEPSGEIKMFDESIGDGNLVIPISGGKYSSLTYNYTSTENYDKMEVYPLIEEDKICEMSDSIKLTKC